MNVQKFFRFFIPLFTALIVLSVGGFLYYNLSYMNAKVSSAYALNVGEEEVQFDLADTYRIEYGIEVINEAMTDRAFNKLKEAQYIFTVMDPSVLEVSEDGLITPKKAGETDIILTFGDLSKTIHVNCYIPLESVSLKEHLIRLNVDDEYPLETIITPDNTTTKVQPTFISKDYSIVDVDKDGTLKALYPGRTTVWMTFEEFSDAATILVSAPLKGIELEQDDITLEKKESFKLGVKYIPGYTTDDTTTTYSLITSELGTITENGVFTPTRTGLAHVRVSVGDFSEICDINIIAHLEGISFPYQELTIRNGETITMPVALEPYDTTDEINITFESSNEKVAKVDEEGVITAVGPGATTIRAICGKFTCEMVLNVVIPVSGIRISETNVTIEKGTTRTLYATVLPENTTEEKYIDWASDNGKVAYVENGVITAVGPGTCHIRAYHDDFVATCTVTVYAPLKSISFTQGNITLLEGDGTDLSIIYNPVDTTDDKTVTYASDDPSIASISGNRLTAVAEGTTTISATVGSIRTYATVKVNPYIKVESISLNKSAVSFTTMGDTFKLVPTVYPSNATNASVSYTSSNNTIATVDGSGVIHAAGSGDCVITASSGGKSATVSVHVDAPNIIVVLDPGHDSSHTGAYYFGIEEHIINLKVAQYCKSYLEANYAGVTVKMTRETASCLNTSTVGACLYQRALFAQQNNASIFVAIHFNACTNHNATGTQCFIQSDLNGHTWIKDQSNRLGNCITSEVCAKFSAEGQTIINRGNFITTGVIDQSTGQLTDWYDVLRHCANMNIPAVIVEECFMDHDYDWISSETYLKAFGESNAEGIARYLGLSAK